MKDRLTIYQELFNPRFTHERFAGILWNHDGYMAWQRAWNTQIKEWFYGLRDIDSEAPAPASGGRVQANRPDAAPALFATQRGDLREARGPAAREDDRHAGT